MIYLLFVVLLGLTISSFYNDGRHFNSPIFIVSMMFTICCGVYCTFFDLMGRDISFITFIVIVFGLLCWGFGQLLAKSKFGKSRKNTTRILLKYDIPLKVVLVCCVIILITVYFALQYFLEIGLAFGGGDLFSAYGAARVYTLKVQEGDYSVIIPKSSLLILFEMFGSSIAYYFLYVSLYNKILFNEPQKIYILPVVCYLPIMFFATSRMIFFLFIVMFFAIYTSLMYSKGNIKTVNKKILRIAFLLIFLGAIIFKIGGDIRGGAITADGRVSETSEISTDLCMYIASNIYALNYYLEGEREFHFGDKTLGGFRQILGRLGVSFPIRPRHMENVYYKTGGANVYTGFKEDIVDYTIWGYWIYIIFIGYICGYFYYKSYEKSVMPNAVFFVVLGKIYYPIFIYFYTDDFYGLTGVDFFVPLFLLIGFNRYIIKYYIVKVNE